jgi:hypothetical protein
MEETSQNFEKRFFINRSYIFIVLPKFNVKHCNYEILSKSLVPTQHGSIWLFAVNVKITSPMNVSDTGGFSVRYYVCWAATP